MPKRRLTRKSGQQSKPDDPQLSFKQRLALKRKRDRHRKELIRFTIVAFLFSTLLGFIVAIATREPKAGLAVCLGILYTSLSFRYPSQALWALLIYLPFGGTITYAIGNSPLLQLAKDGFYIPALFGVIQFCRREHLPVIINKTLFAPLMLLAGYCCLVLLVVNGSQQLGAEGEYPILLGILGVKVLLGYVPLMVCGYYLVKDRKTLFFMMRLTVVLILICCGLAFLQYLWLKTGRCEGTRNAIGEDLFKASLDARCLVGGSLLYSPEQGQIRLPGTFVAPWQWGWFLISSAFLAFACAFNDPLIRWRTVGLSAMAAVFIMAVLSGQRIALALVPVTTLLLLVLTGQVANLKRFIPVAAVLSMLLGLAAAYNPQLVETRIDSFQSRWEAAPPHVFIRQQFDQAIAQQPGFLGNGLGRATNSGRVLGETALVETYYPKLIYEIGIAGALLFLLFVTVLTYQTFKSYRSVGDRTLRSYGASFWVYVLFISYNTYYYPLDVDPVAIYYWFFAGVILKLPEIDRQEQLSETDADAEPSSRKRKRLRRSKTFA
ncbi:MAG: hormogonium polysaccharide biosynthesis protein HpsL [Elainellaceae cyanobacterium]